MLKLIARAHPTARLVILVSFAAVLSSCMASVSPGDGAESEEDPGARSPWTQPPTLDFQQPPDPRCTDGAWVGQVGGAVLWENNAPLPGAKVQLCVHTAPDDRLVCLRPADADVVGHFVIDVPMDARCMRSAVIRSILPDSTASTVYCPADVSSSSGAVWLSDPIVVFGTHAATEIPAEAPQSASRTVTITPEMQIDLVPAELYTQTGSYESLSARRVDPNDPNLCQAWDAGRFEAVYAFHPEADITGESRLRVANTTGLPPGTEVKLHVLGGLSCSLSTGEMVPEGDWQEYGTGIITPDGTMVDTGRAGLPCLTWFAFSR